MLLTTTDFIPGREIVKVLGFISGNNVQSSGLEKEGMAILKGFRMKGGEVQELAEITSQLREEALRRMSGKAAQLGANAVMGVSIQLSNLSSANSMGTTNMEAYACGTAVVLN